MLKSCVAIVVLSMLVVIGCGGGGASSSTSNSTAASLSGNWNVEMKRADSSDFLNIGLNITQTGTMLQGTTIPYTGALGSGNPFGSCFDPNTLHITQGAVNGSSVAIILQDSLNTINMPGTFANGAITGNFGFNATPAGNRSGDPSPGMPIPGPCASYQGTFSIKRQ